MADSLDFTPVPRKCKRRDGWSAERQRGFIAALGQGLDPEKAAPTQGIQVALRLNLPLYANVPAGEAGALRWSAARRADGGWTLEAANAGSGYVRLDPAAAEAATGIRFGDDIAFGTVLPGAIRRWTIGRDLEVADAPRFARIAGTQSRETAAADRD